MRNKGAISVSVVTTSGKRRDSILSFTDQLSIPSIAVDSDLKQPDCKIQDFSPTDTMASSSKDSLDFGRQDSSHQMVVTLPTIPPTSVPPHHADLTEVTIREFSFDAANAV